jgi:hypothetical protein
MKVINFDFEIEMQILEEVCSEEKLGWTDELAHKEWPINR